MNRDRRRYYVIGLAVGLAAAALFAFGPKTTAEQQVARDIAILVTEPWDSVHVVSIDFQGPSARPSDALLRGVRPNGTPVLVHFAADTPYTAPTAIRRLQERAYVGLQAEILMVPRSLVLSKYRKRFNRHATHAGIAIYASVPAPVSDMEASDDATQPLQAQPTGG